MSGCEEHYTVTQLNHAHKYASKHVFSLLAIFLTRKSTRVINFQRSYKIAMEKQGLVSKNDCQTISSITPESCVKHPKIKFYKAQRRIHVSVYPLKYRATVPLTL